MSALGFAIDALATFRIARLITEDSIFDDVREWVWKKHPPESTKVGYFLTCPHCVSVWAAGVVAVSHLPSSRLFTGTVEPLRHALALSGAVSLAHEVLSRME